MYDVKSYATWLRNAFCFRIKPRGKGEGVTKEKKRRKVLLVTRMQL